jgi:hypothetical protein
MSLPVGEPRAILNTRFYEGGFQFSPPDGRLVVFASDETGQMEVSVALASNPKAKTPVTAPRGGTQPLWARNGRELFYRRGDEIRVINVSAQSGTVKLSDDRLLFERRYAFGSGLTRPNYDVDLNDERLLMVKDESDSGRLNVVLNWLEELKRRVPTN